MLATKIPEELQRTYLEHIVEGVRREEQLVEELIMAAQLESGRIEYQFKAVNAYQYFSDIASDNDFLVKHSIKERYGLETCDYICTIADELKDVSIHIDGRHC